MGALVTKLIFHCSHCNWEGVACDNLTSHIFKLDLKEGFVMPGSPEPPFFYPLAGEVNPSLLELKYLTHLTLSVLDFNGSTIPKFFGSMTQLQYLDLSNSNFSGEVPHNLGNLTKLVHLDLSFTSTSLNNLEWVSKLENLQYLDLSGISLSQATDSFNLLFHKLVSSLFVLNLRGCQLGNSQQVKTNLSITSSPLTELDISLNYFSGLFPSFIQNLSFIKYLDLGGNKFSSSIPSCLSEKRDFEHIGLSDNHFDRVDGIMNTLGHLCWLRFFDLSNNLIQEEVSEYHANSSNCATYDLEELSLTNNNISSQLPITESFVFLQSLGLSQNRFSVVHQLSFANLSSLMYLNLSSDYTVLDLSHDWEPPFQLTDLDISHTKLNGPFPKWLLNQTNLSVLELSDTGIFGPLPDIIGNVMPTLHNLQLANNRINGSIPKSLCNITSLNILDLRSNWLSGMIPDCWKSNVILNDQGPYLEVFEVSSNTLSGPIPNSLTKIVSLQLLNLNNNLLEGQLPEFSTICERLVILDVGKNNLHGEFSSWNGSNFPSLQILILRENRLKGVIPPQLCSIHKLQVIDIAKNNLIGTIPQCFGHFQGMGSTQYQSYSVDPSIITDIALRPTVSPDQWSAVEVVKGEEREYTSVLHLLVNMDLSCNNLAGDILTNLTSLSLLIGLNLSHNHFIGAIPGDIGNMEKLESLDLSSNILSGVIPESLSSSNFLSAMNLSFNNLYGQIPTGNQLQVLDDPSIYWGNQDCVVIHCQRNASVMGLLSLRRKWPSLKKKRTKISVRRCGSTWSLLTCAKSEFVKTHNHYPQTMTGSDGHADRK